MTMAGYEYVQHSPEMAARVVLIAHVRQGSVQNAWDVLVSGVGPAEAAAQVRAAVAKDEQFKGVVVDTLIRELRENAELDQDTYQDGVDKHWYVVDYGRRLSIHSNTCETCKDAETHAAFARANGMTSERYAAFLAGDDED